MIAELRFQPTKWATDCSSSLTCRVSAIARYARLNFMIVVNLGFRSAPPRLYNNATLRGLSKDLIRAFFSLWFRSSHKLRSMLRMTLPCSCSKLGLLG